MKLSILALAAVLLAPSLAIAEAVAPTRPIEVSVEVAGVTSAVGKVTISLKATVDKKEIGYAVVVRQSPSFVNFEMSLDDAVEASKAVSKCAKDVDAKFEKALGDFKVQTGDFGKQRVVELADTHPFSTDRIYFDSEAAESLSKALAKCQGIREWIAERLKPLQAK